MCAKKFGRYKTEVEERIKKGKASAKKQGGIGKTLRDLRRIERRDIIGMGTYLHGPTNVARTLKLRFRAGGLDLPEKRKRYTSSRDEKEVDAQMCPCGKAIE